MLLAESCPPEPAARPPNANGGQKTAARLSAALRIDELAREVNLSVSTLHHRFKAVTAMSPLHYQKQLRLQEARKLMLNDGLEACAAGYRVDMKARRSSAPSTAGCSARHRCGTWRVCARPSDQTLSTRQDSDGKVIDTG